MIIVLFVKFDMLNYLHSRRYIDMVLCKTTMSKHRK